MNRISRKRSNVPPNEDTDDSANYEYENKSSRGNSGGNGGVGAISIGINNGNGSGSGGGTSTSGDDQRNYPCSGKWTTEEEMFANSLIVEFKNGLLTDCEEGITLRSYLASKLRCAPMRISKKFAGKCIGKLPFVKKVKGFGGSSSGNDSTYNNGEYGYFEDPSDVNNIASSSRAQLELMYDRSYQAKIDFKNSKAAANNGAGNSRNNNKTSQKRNNKSNKQKKQQHNHMSESTATESSTNCRYNNSSSSDDISISSFNSFPFRLNNSFETGGGSLSLSKFPSSCFDRYISEIDWNRNDGHGSSGSSTCSSSSSNKDGHMNQSFNGNRNTAGHNASLSSKNEIYSSYSFHDNNNSGCSTTSNNGNSNNNTNNISSSSKEKNHIAASYSNDDWSRVLLGRNDDKASSNSLVF